MPRAKQKNAPGLEIQLHPPVDPSDPNAQPSIPLHYNPIYHPGSNITGTVTLTSTSDIPIGSVHIVFYGRAKVKVWQSHGQSSAEYRSIANLFRVSHKLFEGGYTFKPGSWQWPFSITCPSAADANVLRKEGDPNGKVKTRFKPRAGYLDTLERLSDGDIEAGIAEHAFPPPTMQYTHRTLGRDTTAYVEYVLSAVVIEPDRGSGSGGGIFGRVRGPKKRMSTKIIELLPTQNDAAADVARSIVTGNFQPVIRSSKLSSRDSSNGLERSTSRTSELNEADLKTMDTGTINLSNPDIKGLDSNSSLSADPVITSQHSSKLFSRLSLSPSLSGSSIFSRSFTPRLTLDVAVSYPQIIQVASTQPIPFSVAITPNLSNQATNISPDALPKVLVKSCSFTVVCRTRVRAFGLPGEDTKTVSIKLAEDFPVNQIIDLSPSSSLAQTPQNISTDKIGKPVNTENTDTTKATTKATNMSIPEKATSLSASFSNTIPPSSLPSHPISSIPLGHLAELRLHAAQIGKVLEPLLTPTFATYNITREYGIKYAVEIELLGTGKGESGSETGRIKEKVKGVSEIGYICVLGASDGVREKIFGVENRDSAAGGQGAATVVGAGVDGLPGYAEVVDEDPDSGPDQDNNHGNGDARHADEKRNTTATPKKGGGGLSRFLGGSRAKDRERDEEGAGEGGDGDGNGNGNGNGDSSDDDVLPLYTR